MSAIDDKYAVLSSFFSRSFRVRQAFVRSLNLVMVLVLLFGLSVQPKVFAQSDLTGFYSSNDGGAYYVRQIGNRIFWFGEGANNKWANVLTGTISGNRISARWWDVPKGGTQGSGQIELNIVGNSLTKISATGGFGGTFWVRQTVSTSHREISSNPTPNTPIDSNLTGAWDSDDFGMYYVRQSGEDVIWIGVHRLLSKPFSIPAFANVFVGRKSGNTITGEWADIPTSFLSGGFSGSGTLSLRLDDPNQMTRSAGSGFAGSKWRRSTPSRLWGFVDMHTHPGAQWGFGEQVFHGGLDGDPAAALGSCNCLHNFVPSPFDGNCGQQNFYRNKLIDSIDQEYGTSHLKYPGFPNFDQWPRYNSVTHQQMWYEWIKRAYDGGLRVMVALTVSSHVIADAAETGGANDDLRSMNKQIEEIKAFVARHDEPGERGFMEMAYSPGDLRRIVSQNKLAIVLGTEMDNLGNFYNPADRKGGIYNPNPSDSDIFREIDRLYGLGVRYIIPIHITNNVFGGSAIYQEDFDIANKYNTGSRFNIKVADTASSGIGYKLRSPYAPLDPDATKNFFAESLMSFTGSVIPGHIMPNNINNYPLRPDPGPGKGHYNALGLTPQGARALRYMMAKGIMLDIDHMSALAVIATKDIASASDIYPLNSGHNGFRGAHGNENERNFDDLAYILGSGGLFGLGHGGEATGFLANYRKAQGIWPTNWVAIGTDVNGFYPLPGKPQTNATITYASFFPPARTGNKEWNYNNEGVAHYGLLPDYIRSWQAAGMTEAELNNFFATSERFAQMWERSEALKAAMPLELHWSGERGDNFLTATATGTQSAAVSGYGFARVEGFVYPTQRPGTVPLELYWSSARGDNFSTATDIGKKSARDAGYSFVRVEGYVYPTQRTGTVPLELYWSPAREDNFVTATAVGKKSALDAGYTFVRIEGYVLPP